MAQSKEFTEGYNAMASAFIGCGGKTNPYRAGTQQHQDWESGAYAADDDLDDSNLMGG